MIKEAEAVGKQTTNYSSAHEAPGLLTVTKM